jgi:hypothetical protein
MINKGIEHFGLDHLPGSMAVRADSNESLAMARQLEYIMTTVYKYKYPDAVGRTLMPVDTSVPSGAKSYTYRVTDQIGKAAVIDSYADDFPLVQVRAEEQSALIQGIGNAFFVSIQDVRAAAMAGIDIDSLMAIACREEMERTFDALTATGSAKYKLNGFASDPNVTSDSLLIAGSTPGLTGAWTNPATAATSIVSDLELLGKYVFNQSSSVWGNPDNGTAVDLVVDYTLYSAIVSKRLNTFNDDTIMSYIQKGRNPFIKSIRSWGRLSSANAGANGPRLVAYVNNPQVLSVVVPQDFEMLPMEIKGAGYEVPCHMRTGGVRVTYPAGMMYADNLQ